MFSELDLSQYPKPSSERDFDVLSHYLYFKQLDRTLDKFSKEANTQEFSLRKTIIALEGAEWFIDKIAQHAEKNAKIWLQQNQNWIKATRESIKNLKKSLNLKVDVKKDAAAENLYNITPINVAISAISENRSFKLIKSDANHPFVYELNLQGIPEYKHTVLFKVLKAYSFDVSVDELNQKIRLKTDLDGLFWCESWSMNNFISTLVHENDLGNRILNSRLNHENNMKASSSITAAFHLITGDNMAVYVNASLGGDRSHPDPYVEVLYHHKRFTDREVKALVTAFTLKGYVVQKSINDTKLILRPTEPGVLANFDPKGLQQVYLSTLKQEINHGTLTAESVITHHSNHN